MTGIKPFELSLWGDRLNNNNQFEEYRVCTVASDTMDSSVGAFDVKLVTKINGDNLLTFSMYYQFIDTISGEVVKNEIAELLHNEAKLKLHYDSKWYDFVIKDVKKDSSKYSYNFTAKDANIQELSKNGYNLSLTEVQSNNVGTITELGNVILADTDWVVSENSNKLYEITEELVLLANTVGTISAKKLTIDEQTGAIVESLLEIFNNKPVYVFYSNLENKNTRVLFLYRDTWQKPNTKDGVIKDDTWIECYYDISSAQYSEYHNTLGIDYPSFLTIPENVELGLKAKKHVYNVFNLYSPTLERYVYKYIKNEVEYARDFSTKRDIPVLYQDVCTGGRNIKSLDGWSVTTSEKNSLSNEYEYDTTEGTQSYLRWTKRSGNILCNSGIFDNRKYIGAIVADQEWLVEVIYKYGPSASGFKPLFITKTSTLITLNATEISSTSDGGWITTLWKIVISNGTWPIISEREFNLDEKVLLLFVQSIDDAYVDIKKCSLFRSMGLDEDGNYYTPDNISKLVNTEDKTTYYYYNWEDVIGDNRITDKSELKLQAQVDSTSDLVETYIPVYTCEKTRAVTIEKSNYFNAILSICESFKCWADFDIQRDENGKIINKQIIFKEYINHPNYAGFKYGLNLSGITRTIKSDQIVTKLLVQPNNNEFAPNKVCTIQLAGANPTADTFIYDMRYYVNKKMLDALKWDDDLYVTEWEEKDNTDTELARNNGAVKGYYPALKYYNKKLLSISDALATASGALSEAEGRLSIAENGKKSAEHTLVKKLPEAILKIPSEKLVLGGSSNLLNWDYTELTKQKTFTVQSSLTGATYGTTKWRYASQTVDNSEIITINQDSDGTTTVKFVPILNNTGSYYGHIALDELDLGIKNTRLILSCDIRGYLGANNSISPNFLIYHSYTGRNNWSYRNNKDAWQNLYTDEACTKIWNPSDIKSDKYTRVYWKADVSQSNLSKSNGKANYYFGFHHKDGAPVEEDSFIEFKNIMVGKGTWRNGGSPLININESLSENGVSINNTVSKGTPNNLGGVGYLNGIAKNDLVLGSGNYIMGAFIRCDDSNKQYGGLLSLGGHDSGVNLDLINDGQYHFYTYKTTNGGDNYAYFGVYPQNWSTLSGNFNLPFSIEFPLVLTEEDWNTYISPLLKSRDYYISELPKALEEVDRINKRIESLKLQYNDVLKKKLVLNKKFFTKYKRFIQEGTWSNDKCIDPNLYYNDALVTLSNSSLPKVSYDIKVTDISGLEEYSDFCYRVGDETTILDPDFFGWELDDNLQPTAIPKRETIIVSEATYNLQNPSKNTLKVQTYKTLFNDLFNQITASVQSVTYAQGGFERAAEFMRAVDEEKSQFITSALNNAAAVLQHGSTVTTDNTGIRLQDSIESNKMVHLAGGGILLSNDGGKTWRTGITADGIAADVITSGVVNTGVLRIMNGNDSTFMWNSYGLTAYDFESLGNRIINVDYDKGVRFNRFGIYGTNNLVNESNETTESLEDVVNNSVFALTWDGLKVSGNDGAIIKIGKQYTNNNILSSIFEVKKGDDVRFRIDADGNVYIGGSATIGGSSTLLNNIRASIEYKYARNSDNEHAPTSGWQSTPLPLDENNIYLWIKETSTNVDGSTSEQTYIGGTFGTKGDKGDDGTSVTISSTSILYVISNSGTTTPSSGWTNNILTLTDSNPYLWTRTVVNYSNGTSTTSYSVSKKGDNGATGAPIKLSLFIYARNSSTTAPTAPSSWITETSTTPSVGVWTTAIPDLNAGANNSRYNCWKCTLSTWIASGQTIGSNFSNSVITRATDIENNYDYSSWKNAVASDSTHINGATIATGTVMAGIVRVYDNDNTLTLKILFEANGSNHTVQIAGWEVDANSITTGTLGAANSMWLVRNGSNTSASIAGSSDISGWCIGIGANFGVTKEGTLYAQGSIRSGMTGISDTTNEGYYLGADGITLGKGVFKVTKAGYLTATSGKIGSFFLSTYLTSNSSKITYNDTSSDGVFIGSTGIGLGKGNFTVSDTGSLTAKSGTVGGWTIKSDSIENEGIIMGATSVELFKGNNYGLTSKFSGSKLSIGFNDGSGGYIALVSSNKSNRLAYLMGDDIFIGERAALGGLITGLKIYPSDWSTNTNSTYNKTVRYAGVWKNNSDDDKIYGAVFN